MSKVFFYIRNSKITNPKVLRKLFDELQDGKYTCEVVKESKRSLAQNAYLHGVVIPLVFEGLRSMGWNEIRDQHDAKQVIKTLFLKRRIENPETWDIIEVIKDTSELSTLEMSIFWDEVTQWAAAYLGVTIPAPNTQVEIDYVNGTI